MSRRSMLLVLLVLGVVAVWAWSATSPTPRPAIVPSDDRAAPQPSEPIAQPEPATTVPPPAPPPPPPAAPIAPPTAEPPVAEQPAIAPPPRATRPADVFPGAFEQETRDASWAPDAESKIRAVFDRSNVPAESVLGVECRAALCKLDLLFDRGKQLAFSVAYAHLHEDFALDLGFGPDYDATSTAPQRISVYVPRKGYRLQDFTH